MYEGLQKHKEDDDNVKFNTMENLKTSNIYNDIITKIKNIKEVNIKGKRDIDIKAIIKKIKHLVCNAEVKE